MLQLRETTAPTPGLLACVAKTRIGLSGVFGETRTEPLPFVSHGTHRTSTVSRPELASDLGLYSQPDPIGLKGGANLFLYSDANPTTITDRQGLSSCGNPPDDSSGLACAGRCLVAWRYWGCMYHEAHIAATSAEILHSFGMAGASAACGHKPEELVETGVRGVNTAAYSRANSDWLFKALKRCLTICETFRCADFGQASGFFGGCGLGPVSSDFAPR